MNVDNMVNRATMIRDLPADEKPRERLRALGANQLSNPELIAILLRTGIKGENVLSMSTRVISGFGGLAGLARSSFSELCETNGISEAKACQILAAFELGRRAASLLPDDRTMIRTPADIHNLLGAEMSVASQEKLRVVLLNAKAEVISVQEVYQGTVDATHVRVSEVLRPAVRENFPAIIIVHNHPSGDPQPSTEDIAMTEQAIEAGALLDIEVIDHIVLAHGRFESMKTLGAAFR